MADSSKREEVNRPALLILAAGLGTRYGGFKQLDAFGPHGEALMEYSIFDAIRAGFKRVVFVINQNHTPLFKAQILPKYRERIDVDFVIQKIDDLPAGIHCASDRKKPWGTGHAILSARNAINVPFAVINADDFYGASAFKLMKDVLEVTPADANEFCLIGYELSNTLSDHGGVSRGLCSIENGYLSSITELTGLERSDGRIYGENSGHRIAVSGNEIVSMNFWGFTPSLFEILETRFIHFLKNGCQNGTAEFYIADPVDYAIKEKISKVRLHSTTEKWFGVTYPADQQTVRRNIETLIRQGRYPEKL